ncbi:MULTISPECIES: hypothetical protein [Nocardiaceae]|uniref:hypothetical protein n=1 Tax=Nocardiaceae TaxID=85025 RepID=UPI00070CD774|nr:MULTISPECIES: hypothetical protein [Rhodococcus]KQU35757.1 hypothetical protein ASH04_24090 [Rhodococcus sp. Leaf233]MBP2527411.1 threonine synthase [Rhodococcus sp. PvP104]WQH31120.1 hypothetical protein U2G91_26540 [Rhodococcus fascians]
MTLDITESDLADMEYTPREQLRCSCNSIREGAGGMSYSYAVLGVNCPDCESYSDDCSECDRWNNLTRDERIAEIVSAREVTAALIAATDRPESPF